MEDIEIEYLDEYKDLVLPGIKTNPEGRANQALVRLPQQRRISSDSSGSSSIDPDIFQKLFDGKFLDDELLSEKGSNPKCRSRCRLSSSSSDSNDALDALYNRKRTQYNRRKRLESYDSIDDLGDALMGPTLKSKAVPTTASKNLRTVGSRRDVRINQPTKKCNTSPIFKPKNTAESRRPGTRPNGRSSSSSSSNISILHNKKKAITIIKATKPDLKPPKHEPKEDPLNLQEFSDVETDSSFECESDFYEETDGDTPEMSKSIIDLSTDSSLVSSLADTVTPVVSEDESLNQQRIQCTSVVRERLQMYLNSLSSAESPPSSYKYTNREKNSLPREKQSISSDQKDDHPSENLVEHSLANADNTLGTPGSETPQSDVDKSRADYVDANLTYESVERLSRSLAKEITKIGEERTKEFEKRSASKTRISTPPNKRQTLVQTSPISKTHVRKLTYSNEHLNETTPLKGEDQQGSTDTVIPKRRRGRPSKKRELPIQKRDLPIQPINKKEEEPTVDNVKTEELHPVVKIKRKPGRPPKKKRNVTYFPPGVSEKLSGHADPNGLKCKSESVITDEQHDLNNSKIKTHPINTSEESNMNGSIELSNKTEVSAAMAKETEVIIGDTEDHSTHVQNIATENLGIDMKHAEKKDNSEFDKQYSAKDKTGSVDTSGAEGEEINSTECGKLGRGDEHNEDFVENTKTGSDENASPGLDGFDDNPQAGLALQTSKTKKNKSLKIESKDDKSLECLNDINMNDGNESTSSMGMPIRKRLLRSDSVSSGIATIQLRNSPRLAGKLPLTRSLPGLTKGTRSQKRNTSSKMQTSDSHSKTGSDSPSLEQAAPVTKRVLNAKDVKSRTVDQDIPDESIKTEGKEKSSAESTSSVTKDVGIELSKSTLSFHGATVLKTDIEMDSKDDQGSAPASVTQTEEKMTGIVRGKKALHSKRGQKKSHCTMAASATPKRELSTGKAVLRSLGKTSKMDEGPKPKHNKLSAPAEDGKESLSVEQKETLLAITDAESAANKTPKRPLLREVTQRDELQKPDLKVTKKNEAHKSPSLKSSLLTLVSGDESTAINNSVIITKTPIMGRTEPIKKVETPATPTCGINISVSYYSPSKKLASEAETLKEMKQNLSTKNRDDAPDALTTLPLQKLKMSLPAETVREVDVIGKHLSQADKASAQRMAGRAVPMVEVMQIVSNEKESESLKDSVSANTEASKTTENLPGTKSQEVLEAQGEAQKEGTVSSPSESSDSCNERKKFTARTPKLSRSAPSALTRANNRVNSLARAPTPMAKPNLQEQPTNSINVVQADVPAPNLSEVSESTAQSPAKCPKEPPVASDPSVAFPVRIIAATIETVPGNVKSMAESIASNQSQAPPVIVTSKQVGKENESKQKAELLLGTERKLRVRLKRYGVKNLMEGSNGTPIQPVPRIIQADDIPTPTQTEAGANNTQAGAPAMSVPLPVPLPPLEVKTEQMESLQQQGMGLDMPVVTVAQTAVNTSTTNSTITTITPSSTSATCTTTSTPSASIASDQNTCGATKMFSFLYPSRYRSSYGNVGLDCCCPNLDGPMQAIDPTRLHSKAEVPVLELPECVVITTKIISKHDKNIPPKVKAKLEQLTAKDSLPCAIQAISMSSKDSATAATPIVHTSTTVSTPPSNNNIPLSHSNNTAERSESYSSVGTNVSTTSCIGNLHEDLRARVQCFDDLFQSLARQAASISMTERKSVVNNIVKTISLQPAEVEIGMKLLKDYAYHVNAVMRPRVFPVVASSPTAAKKARTGMNSALSMGTNSTESPNLRQSLGTRPIFDKGNIIGYQYLPVSGNGSAAHPLISKDTNAMSSNITGSRYLHPSPGEEKQVRMGPQNLLNASPVQKSCGGVRLTPVNKVLSPVSSIPLLETNPPALGVAGKEDDSNHNLFIVNQVMSPPEECILPDAIGTLDVATEIKGEVDDAELLA